MTPGTAARPARRAGPSWSKPSGWTAPRMPWQAATSHGSGQKKTCLKRSLGANWDFFFSIFDMKHIEQTYDRESNWLESGWPFSRFCCGDLPKQLRDLLVSGRHFGSFSFEDDAQLRGAADGPNSAAVQSHLGVVGGCWVYIPLVQTCIQIIGICNILRHSMVTRCRVLTCLLSSFLVI